MEHCTEEPEFGAGTPGDHLRGLDLELSHPPIQGELLRLLEARCLETVKKYRLPPPTRDRAFAKAFPSARRRMEKAGLGHLAPHRLILLMQREVIRLMAALLDARIKKALLSADDGLMNLLKDVIDPQMHAEPRGWRWATPDCWDYTAAFSGLKACETEVPLSQAEADLPYLALSRAGCILHYQKKGLERSGRGGEALAALVDAFKVADPANH